MDQSVSQMTSVNVGAHLRVRPIRWGWRMTRHARLGRHIGLPLLLLWATSARGGSHRRSHQADRQHERRGTRGGGGEADADRRGARRETVSPDVGVEESRAAADGGGRLAADQRCGRGFGARAGAAEGRGLDGALVGGAGAGPERARGGDPVVAGGCQVGRVGLGQGGGERRGGETAVEHPLGAPKAFGAARGVEAGARVEQAGAGVFLRARLGVLPEDERGIADRSGGARRGGEVCLRARRYG